MKVIEKLIENISNLKNRYKTNAFNIMLYIFILIYTFALPKYAVTNLHDPGSQAAFEYWILNGYQWGKDIFQNVGPLGFLMYPEIFTGQVNIYLKSVSVLLVCSLGLYFIFHREYSCKICKAFLVVMLVLFGTEWAILNLAVLIISIDIKKYSSRKINLVTLPFLCVLGLTKGTYLACLILILIERCALVVLNRDRIKEGFLSVGYATLYFILLWTVLGQDLGNIPNYLLGMADFSANYNSTMMIDSDPVYVVTSLYILLTIIVSLMLSLSSGVSSSSNHSQLFLRYKENFAIAVMVLPPVLIIISIWKHGFIRADGHMMIFYQSTLLFMPICIDLAFRFTRKFKFKLVISCLCLATVVGLFSFFSFINSISLNGVINYVKYTAGNIENSYNFIFGDKVDKLSKSLDHNINEFVPVELKKIVGDSVTTYFGIEPAPYLFSFKYHPMPSTISFTAWSEWIQKKDVEFLRTNPDYLIWQVSSIDNRFYPADGGLDQVEILTNYNGVAVLNDLVLLKKTSANNFRMNVFTSRDRIRLNETIFIPNIDGSLFVKINVQEPWISRLRNIIYKPLSYNIKYELDDGRVVTQRINASQARVGFLAQPLVTNTESLLELIDKENFAKASNAISKIISFKLECDKSIFCAKFAGYELYKVDGPIYGKSNVKQLSGYDKFGVSVENSNQVLNTSSHVPIVPIKYLGELVYLYHAPSEITLKRLPNQSKISFDYGMLPSSWQDGSQSDGVDLIVVANVKGNAEIVFRSTLSPLADQDSRSLKHANIDLKAEYESIKILVSPRGNINSDHFFLNKITVR